MLGPNVTIHNHNKGLRGKAVDFGDTGEFFFDIEDVGEFFYVTNERRSDHIVQAVSISCFCS